MGHHIGIRTALRFLARTFTSIERVTVTNGPCPLRHICVSRVPTRSQLALRSWLIATSLTCHPSLWGCSDADRCDRNRKAARRLPDLAEGSDDPKSRGGRGVG